MITIWDITSKHKSHQVVIRLDEWTEWLTSSEPFAKAAKSMLNGRISFDCDCGRHQYWYRYVATIGGFAIRPLEYAYPKIRNRELVGACCKHTLKVLAALQGPALQRIIVGELKKAADKVGYGDDHKVANRYMTQKELKTAARSSAAKNVPTKREAQKAFQEYKQAKKGIEKKMKEKKAQEALERSKQEAELRAKTFEQIARKEKARGDRLERDVEKMKKQSERYVLKANLNTALTVAVYRDKIPKEEAMATFAKENKLTSKEVAELAEGINI